MLKIIPQPQVIRINQGTMPFKHLALGDSLISPLATEDFAQFCNLPTGQINVHFSLDSTFGDEEYTLTIDDKIAITASTATGQLYALQTLKQIIAQCGDALPNLEIKDKPAYKIRGYMLDVGRYFYSVADVKKIIRSMAMHKLNLLHFHLTEDQGWRVEIDKYPLLTEIGSKRARTNFNHKSHGGFYTKEDIRDIVDYAHAFGVKVMPEFDIPGHSRAAIASYNDLTCFPRDLPVADHWGVKHDVLCVGKDSTLDFVRDVIDELVEMFPDEYIHIGGDEVPKHRWDLCPNCQRRIKELGLENSEQLQFWFMNKVKDYCKSLGKQVFMWNWDLKESSALDDDLGFTKCSDTDTGDRPFIDTSTNAYYIDFPYGYTSLKDSANHTVPKGNCVGVEVTMWTEMVPDMAKLEEMSYPRTACVAQMGWQGNCSWSNISYSLDTYLAFLDRNGIKYASIKKANPNWLRGKLQGLWFERRQLTWQGLTNIIDDKKIEKIAKNK